MSISVETKPRLKVRFRRAYRPTTALAEAVRFRDGMMEVYLTDGRIVSVPLIMVPVVV